MIAIKKGVRLCGISPEMMMAHTVIASVFDKHETSAVVTSALDGVHSRASKHYSGMALDYRIRHITKMGLAKTIADEIRNGLPDDFDVCLESDHIHVEFDPKEPQ